MLGVRREKKKNVGVTHVQKKNKTKQKKTHKKLLFYIQKQWIVSRCREQTCLRFVEKKFLFRKKFILLRNFRVGGRGSFGRWNYCHLFACLEDKLLGAIWR